MDFFETVMGSLGFVAEMKPMLLPPAMEAESGSLELRRKRF